MQEKIPVYSKEVIGEDTIIHRNKFPKFDIVIKGDVEDHKIAESLKKCAEWLLKSKYGRKEI